MVSVSLKTTSDDVVRSCFTCSVRTSPGNTVKGDRKNRSRSSTGPLPGSSAVAALRRISTKPVPGMSASPPCTACSASNQLRLRLIRLVRTDVVPSSVTLSKRCTDDSVVGSTVSVRATATLMASTAMPTSCQAFQLTTTARVWPSSFLAAANESRKALAAV